jgi:hypothetical protein
MLKSCCVYLVKVVIKLETSTDPKFKVHACKSIYLPVDVAVVSVVEEAGSRRKSPRGLGLRPVALCRKFAKCTASKLPARGPARDSNSALLRAHSWLPVDGKSAGSRGVSAN